jgi:Protein of unknown function (DUF3224)
VLNQSKWFSEKSWRGTQPFILLTAVASVSLLFGQGPELNPTSKKKEVTMIKHIKGAFDVKLSPMTFEDAATDSGLGRMSIDKQFHGDLEAHSQGQMLAARTSLKDSAGYVAIERVTGTLQGRKGSFVLQHSGTMNRGVPTLTVTVVPDSGTDQLVGLSGKMNIIIAEGKHSYEFEYALPESH